MDTGKFIVFEGGEGCGKSTQANLLFEWLKKNGYDVLLTKEPGGDEGICREIRSILLNKNYQESFSERTELLLFTADRAQHVDFTIKPALESGKFVISDRYEASTFAYQCGGRKIEPKNFLWLNRYAAKGLRPDFTFWLDLDPKIGLRRNMNTEKRDRFETEDVIFHNQVREGFVNYFQAINSYSYKKLEGQLSIEELHQSVLTTIRQFI
ncbi:MAG: dTMP kinase [Candidatus Niyogibacteria bacterium]|nr:dTMP kinase [Candidatus Niyogibacteria bacterium]